MFGSARRISQQLVRLHNNQAINKIIANPDITTPIISRTMSSSPTYTADYLKTKLTKDLDAKFVDIEDQSNCGCGMKFNAIIVSPQFEGKPLLQRQRLVNETLSEEMKYIHAFTMKTLAPSQWKE